MLFIFKIKQRNATQNIESNIQYQILAMRHKQYINVLKI